jgi:hypothetical protein
MGIAEIAFFHTFLPIGVFWATSFHSSKKLGRFCGQIRRKIGFEPQVGRAKELEPIR